MKNKLFYGDCLDVLRGRDLSGERYIKEESVDLVYLDPPFNSNKVYNVFYKGSDGNDSKAQIKGFDDIWTWNDDVEKELEELKSMGGKITDTIIGLETILGKSNMFAYLVMMATRLIEIRRVMKPTATVYLHCDQTAGHYIKVMMDSIFGVKNFVNEIIWCYRTGGAGGRSFSRKHDNILVYVKTKDYYFNLIKERIYYEKNFFSCEQDDKGRFYADVHPVDWWNIPAVLNMSSERMGYPTQKPEALLEKIIMASCPDGGVVFDPFCGCGTTVAVANRLKLNWIGIDITHIAINLIKHRLGSTAKYDVIGEPKDVAGATQLAKEDEYQFQLWALGLDNARPTIGGIKKGSDKGIDGKRFFHNPLSNKDETIIYSVKGGHTGPRDVRDLKGTVENNHAAMGVLITLEPITKDMRSEAAKGGIYKPYGLTDEEYPKIQVYTVDELMNGKLVQWPRSLKDTTLPTISKKKIPVVAVKGKSLLDDTSREPEDCDFNDEET